MSGRDRGVGGMDPVAKLSMSVKKIKNAQREQPKLLSLHKCIYKNENIPYHHTPAMLGCGAVCSGFGGGVS